MGPSGWRYYFLYRIVAVKCRSNIVLFVTVVIGHLYEYGELRTVSHKSGKQLVVLDVTLADVVRNRTNFFVLYVNGHYAQLSVQL